MKVNVEDLQAKMELGNNGITLSVYDNSGNYKGKLRIGKGKIEWCRGRTRKGAGSKISWEKLLEIFEN